MQHKDFIVRFLPPPAFPALTIPFPSTKIFSSYPAYSFLNPTLQGPKLATYIIGVLLAEVIIFCLVKLIETWRERWAVKRGLVSETNCNLVVDGEDWEEVERPSSAKEGV